MSLKRQIISGLWWAGALRMTSKLLTLVKLVILARLLSPTAFGQFGATVLVLSLFETITETGVNQVLISSKRKVEEFLDSAWIVSIVRGILISVLILLSAFPLSRYFGDSSLLPLSLFVAVVPILRGFINPMVMSFVKNLEFRREFLFRSAGAIVDLTAALVIGLLTHSAIALAGALILSAGTDLVLSFTLFSLRPQFRFVTSYLSEIVGYGKWITLSGVATWLSGQLDDIVVGRLYGVGELGVYQNGYKISTLPVTEISGTVNAVSFPALSKVKTNRTQLTRLFLASALVTNVLGVSAATAIWFFPEFIVHLVLGSQWSAVVPIIRILAIFGALRTLESSVQPLFLSMGRPKIPSIGNVLKVVTLVVGLFLFARQGLEGVAMAALLSVIFVMPYYLVHVVRALRS